MAGLTPEGLVIKTFEEIRAEKEAVARERFGESVPLGDDTFIGEQIAIDADREATLWELLELVYSSQNRDEAADEALDALNALTGTTREGAKSSEVVLTLAGTPGTVVGTGSDVSTLSTGSEFTTLAASIAFAALPSWAAPIAYVVGDRVTDSGDAWHCVVAGTSAPLAPSSAGLDPGDTTVDGGGVGWLFLGAGAGAADVDAASSSTGPVVAVAFDLTVIETPVAGWTSVINLLDAELGQDFESDEEFRQRGEEELNAPGTGPLDAIRVDLLQVEDVTSVTVFQNTSEVTDGDGVPPKSIEALVEGGADQDIWDQLLVSVCAGIKSFGSVPGTADDSEGTAHPQAFSRPSEKPIWVEITLTKDPDEYPTDGDDQVELAITNGKYVGLVGRDAVSSAIKAAADSVAGVLDVTIGNIGLAPGPVTETTIPIGTRELAKYDTSRIIVSSSDGTP